MRIVIKSVISSLLLVSLMACQETPKETTEQEVTVQQPQPVQPRSTQQAQAVAKKAEQGAVKWYSLEEALAANQETPKKFFIDVYTDWCGWCKVMDRKTFSDPKIAAYLNTNFYPVKFDAEQKESITVKGETFEWVAGGRRGVNKLAYSLLNGRLSYPSVVYMNENFERIRVSPGFKTPEQILPELKFAVEEQYLQ
ncbi:MAG: DUF255 domain-containing protein [Saprospiraceae bacterium]|nr:DUF255 domain-containing protein [Saprospiraceae bacterium]